MPIVAIQNKSGKVVIRAVANESYIVAGNNSTSNLVTAGEANGSSANNINVQSAHITKLFWSSTNNVTISRGGNTYLILFGTDHWNLEEAGVACSGTAGANDGFDATANLSITINGTGNVLMELKRFATGYITDY